MGYLILEKNNLWADFWQGEEKEKTKRSMQKILKSLKNAMSPALFSHSNFSSDFIQNFWQRISPILLCTCKEEGKAASLDRLAQFSGFLQEAVPWLWAQLVDSEPVWQSSHSSTRCTSHLDSSHGWRAEAVQLPLEMKEMSDAVKFSHPVAVCLL